MLKAGEDQAHDDTAGKRKRTSTRSFARAVCGPHAARRAAETIPRRHRSPVPPLTRVVPTGERWLYRSSMMAIDRGASGGGDARAAEQQRPELDRPLRSLSRPSRTSRHLQLHFHLDEACRKVGTGFSRSRHAAPRSGLARHTLIGHLVAALRWMSLAGTPGEQSDAFLFSCNEVHIAYLRRASRETMGSARDGRSDEAGRDGGTITGAS